MSDRLWRQKLKKAFTKWDRSTAMYAKVYDPTVEAQALAEWSALINEHELYLRSKE